MAASIDRLGDASRSNPSRSPHASLRSRDASTATGPARRDGDRHARHRGRRAVRVFALTPQPRRLPRRRPRLAGRLGADGTRDDRVQSPLPHAEPRTSRRTRRRLHERLLGQSGLHTDPHVAHDRPASGSQRHHLLDASEGPRHFGEASAASKPRVAADRPRRDRPHAAETPARRGLPHVHVGKAHFGAVGTPGADPAEPRLRDQHRRPWSRRARAASTGSTTSAP